VKVLVVPASDQTRRVHDAVAGRAYQIFKSRKDTIAHQLQDWLQAESELVRPLCHGRMQLNGDLWLGTDARAFEEGTIEIWAAPCQLTICGKRRAATETVTLAPAGAPQDEETIYRVLMLPIEVDPSGIAAKISGLSLEILLRNVETGHSHEPRVAA